MICLTGSADWMPRNLDNRIEVLTPVYDKEIQTELKRIVEYGLKDSLQGRQVDGTGQNIPWENEDLAIPVTIGLISLLSGRHTRNHN